MIHDDSGAFADGDLNGTGGRIARRSFLGLVVAAPVLVTAARIERSVPNGRGGALAAAPDASLVADTASTSSPSGALQMRPILSAPQPADITDLGDFLILAAAPTNYLITVTVQSDGTVDFVMPREENGQGLLTGMAMLIADEMDVSLSAVNVTLADANPALIFNQITGGSSGVRTLYTPVRIAAALARSRLLAAAAEELGVSVEVLSVVDGIVHGPGGELLSYASLTSKAASSTTSTAAVTPKDPSEYKIVGTPVSQLANRSIVTGKELYTTDLAIPGAKPTMVRRAPTQGGTLRTFLNRSEIRAMPGVLDVAALPFGVAIRGETFGQVIDAVNAVRATWHPGPAAGLDDQAIFDELKATALPLAVPPVPSLPVPGGLPVVGSVEPQTIDLQFEWAYVNHAPLEPNVAIADVRADSAEIWGPWQNPIVTLQRIAADLGLPERAVTVHVIRGGGSFGRTLFYDAAEEAAQISKAMGQPVKLMWHRTNDMRQGRGHPHTLHRLRATVLGGSVLSYEHRVSCVQADVNPGLGEILTDTLTRPFLGEMSLDQSLFVTTVTCPYNFGVVDEVLDEIPLKLATASWRSVYSYDTRGSEEILVDELAKAMGQDPLAFRLAFLKDAKAKEVLEKVAEVGDWGRRMAPGTAQGICVNTRDKGYGACLVELDATDPTNPRVTKAVIAVDAVMPINPRSIEGQQLGGLSDAISVVLTAGNPVVDGLPVPDGWTNFGIARQGNYPRDVQVIVMPRDGNTPAGIGESGVPNTAGAIANAYIRATGRMPKSFPINPVVQQDVTPPGLLAPQPNQPLPPKGELYNY